ncbi:MAG: response regulator transcription factor [Chitinophagaceae bacterium]|nr:response regulator transcription factor [Chitinophagaceae bacterium]
MKIKCVITDDEPMARKGLQSYIEKIDFLELAGVCEDAIQLNSLLKQAPVQLLFLDIEMPYVNGIDFLKNHPDPPKVIFTTAYEQYALKGYELDVLDYLLKPISFDRFLKAANKAYDWFQAKGTASQDYIFVKANSKLEKIDLADILFAEAMENYVAIYTRQQKFIANTTLKGLQEKLPPASFIQSHKSYIINIQSVRSVEGNIMNIDKYQVPISKYQKEEVMEKMVNSKLLKK